MGVAWTDVLGTIPRPQQAHDGANGERRVEVRHWYTPANAERPYSVIAELWDGPGRVETWVHEFRPGKGLTDAHRAYVTAMAAAERWLEGRPIDQVHPPGFTATKHRAP